MDSGCSCPHPQAELAKAHVWTWVPLMALSSRWCARWRVRSLPNWLKTQGTPKRRCDKRVPVRHPEIHSGQNVSAGMLLGALPASRWDAAQNCSIPPQSPVQSAARIRDQAMAKAYSAAPSLRSLTNLILPLMPTQTRASSTLRTSRARTVQVLLDAAISHQHITLRTEKLLYGLRSMLTTTIGWMAWRRSNPPGFRNRRG
jgi:hypothetical protein